MTQATITGQRINYEVVFGPDEADRQLYVDYGDGAFISKDAEIRAARFFLQLASARRRCGLWVNGVLMAGEDMTGAEGEQPEEMSVIHKTRTVLDAYQDERYVTKSNGSCGRYVRSEASTALCSCGWKYHAGRRAEARAEARTHRLEAA